MAKATTAEQNGQFRATCDAHWVNGPVPCCDKHAQQLVALGRFMGAHVPLTKLSKPADCANCQNEAGDDAERDGK